MACGQLWPIQVYVTRRLYLCIILLASSDRKFQIFVVIFCVVVSYSVIYVPENMFLSISPLLCSLWCVPTIGYIIACRSYSFVNIFMMRTDLKVFRIMSWHTVLRCMSCYVLFTLRWRHNDHAGVSNHQPHGCLLNRLFRRKSKKTSKLRVTGLCAGNSPGTGEFPAQMASYAENVSIWWRHHESNCTHTVVNTDHYCDMTLRKTGVIMRAICNTIGFVTVLLNNQILLQRAFLSRGQNVDWFMGIWQV